MNGALSMRTALIQRPGPELMVISSAKDGLSTLLVAYSAIFKSRNIWVVVGSGPLLAVMQKY